MIKKGKTVLVLCGKDKGKKGEVIEILKSQNKIKIKGINLVKKHEKTTKEKKGGIISKENFIHISNIKSIDTEKNKEKGKNK
jgi:large subunit ribosomal protein L24